MAHQVAWLPAALDDLEAIAQYIAVDSPAYASAVVARVLSEARALATFPRMGRRVPEWDDDQVRELIVYNDRLIYQVLESSVLILAVIHGARILTEGWRNRIE